jgi:hypothetical protein
MSQQLDLVGDVGWVEAEAALSTAEARGLIASRSLPEGCDTGAGHVARLENFNKREALKKLGHNRKTRGRLEWTRHLIRARRVPPDDQYRCPPCDYFDREYEGTGD